LAVFFSGKKTMVGKMKPFHRFARQGDVSGVTRELEAGLSVDMRDGETGWTALMEAVSSEKANEQIVRLLIERGADVNAWTEEEGIPNEALENAMALLENHPEMLPAGVPAERIKAAVAARRNRVPKRENVLGLALRRGKMEIVRMLLDAGADIQYRTPGGYEALIDVMYGRDIACDGELLPLVRLLIERGARLNGRSNYSESALSRASLTGRFDVVQVLLDAGAESTPLHWTALMRAIALGTRSEVERALRESPDLEARDGCERTAWLLSLQSGDVEISQMVLAAGAKRVDRGRCGKTPLMYPIARDDAAMMSWLLSEGLDPNEADKYGQSPLVEAAESGAAECVQILLAGGAELKGQSSAAMKSASTLEIVWLLAQAGADLNDISDEMRASLVSLPGENELDVSRDDYEAARHRQFGRTNPEKMNSPFWCAMVRAGTNAYRARAIFDDMNFRGEAVWCYQRYGKSINVLTDGRIIEIAGEHEDSYDPDFCIYNDVFVHHGHGRFDIYGYPKEIFPPTDFHTATQVGTFLYIIGSLGYRGQRRFGETPVYRLDLKTLKIERVETHGDNPGWIHRHKAAARGDEIWIRDGKICVFENEKEEVRENAAEYVLNVRSREWRKVEQESAHKPRGDVQEC
jgi:ankyrin repeat protein